MKTRWINTYIHSIQFGICTKFEFYYVAYFYCNSIKHEVTVPRKYQATSQAEIRGMVVKMMTATTLLKVT